MIQIIKEDWATRELPNGRRSGHRGYKRSSDRKRATSQLYRQGFNYFVWYRDIAAEFALSYSWSEWVEKSGLLCYVDR